MKNTKIFLMLIIICGLSSCNNGKANLSSKIQEIDGCEYIVSINTYGNLVSHKGNCKNPFHNKVIHDTIYVVEKK